MWCTGLVAPRHVGSSRTRDRTHVPCIGRRILNHCAAREVPPCLGSFCFYKQPVALISFCFQSLPSQATVLLNLGQVLWCYRVVSYTYSHHFLLGCQEIAEEFRSQEIDGQALLLLKEEHLMSAMNIKLGPALKICAKINVLKET